MMEFSGLFSSGDLIDDETVSEVYAAESVRFELAMTPDHETYIQQRRKLLGPAADITHPEFGRPNQPFENFAVFYRVLETLAKRVEGYDDNGNKILEPVHEYRVSEYVFDSEGSLVQVEEL